MSSRSRDPTHPRSKQPKNWRTVHVDMKAKSTSRLQEHFFVRFTMWAQPTLTGFLPLQVALNERTHAPLNPLQELCSALWLREKSDLRFIFSWRAAKKYTSIGFFFFCVSVFSRFQRSQTGWRRESVGKAPRVQRFHDCEEIWRRFARNKAFPFVMVVEDQFQARAFSSVWRAQNCWLSFGATDDTLHRQAPTRPAFTQVRSEDTGGIGVHVGETRRSLHGFGASLLQQVQRECSHCPAHQRRRA